MPNADNATRVRSAVVTAGEVAVLNELAKLITQVINLNVRAEEIDPDAPLYGEGLGLDSIDILEIALVVAKRYDLQLKADSEENTVIFKSLRNLARYVVTNSKGTVLPEEVKVNGSD